MSKHIYLIAGEASGDFLGAQLMAALKRRDPDVQFSGVGGELMSAQGLNSLFDMSELSLMGIAEILPKLKSLIGRINQTTQDIIDQNPDVVITIDAPDFCFRVQKKIRKNANVQPTQIHYVAPTVWAWRPKRAKKISKFLDAVICLFDFEPPYFERVGLRAIAVGHPMMESGLQEAAPKNIGRVESQKLGVFFGSRQGEIKRISPVIITALKEITTQKSDIELVIPTLPRLKPQIENLLKDLNVPCHIETNHTDKWAVFKACDAAIAVSGTVGLELAACNVPHLIAYKMNALTAMIVRRVIKTPFAHLANIILGRDVVPEFIQEECTVENIGNTTISLLDDEQAGIHLQNAFADVRARIGGENSPSDVAADFILKI